MGYEDLNDHEQLGADPLFGLLSGQRDLAEPLAGESTLNRLNLTGRSARYHKIGYSSEANDRLLVDLFVELYGTAQGQVVLNLDATDIPLYGHLPERSSMATTTATANRALHLLSQQFQQPHQFEQNEESHLSTSED